MPFECRHVMTWGPGSNPVQLMGGDEVPAPVKKSLIKAGWVVEVAEVSGKKWSEQPEEAQQAWAESNGQTFVIEHRKGEEDYRLVESKRHESNLVGLVVEAEADSPPEEPEPHEGTAEAVDHDAEAVPSIEAEDLDRTPPAGLPVESKPAKATSGLFKKKRGRKPHK